MSVPRIKDTDVVLVRERARVDEVIRDVVTLKPAGGGSLKGLCPFHDERSPSFNVTPSRGFWHCFGCQEGGDVIDFVRKIDHLSFAEAVEKLAARTGVQLRYEEGGTAPDKHRGQRIRLVEAHAAAAEFFAEQLASPEAEIGRTFMKERDFDQAACEKFGVGYAPNTWDSLTKHLRSKGFTDTELTTGGLAVSGNRGAYDRFRGRLLWPIRDLSGDVVGFGARRLREDDEGPKYLNTPETPLYKKSQVLYGVDMARKDISKRQQAVVVEGYTDVMACHLSGVETAVATCGTAFGPDHIKVLRRLLMDQDEFRGEVIFAFDSDAAGRKAALKAFSDDQRFVSQTFVAIERSGKDPCELRQASGPDAVRELIATRVPLFEFAIKASLDDYNLDTAEGRVKGLQSAAPMIAGIRDQALRPEYVRLTARWLGMENEIVAEAVKNAGRAKPKQQGTAREQQRDQVREQERERVASQATAATTTWERPNPRDTAAVVEREALKCAMQIPHHVAAWYEAVEPDAFTTPIYRVVHEAITAAGSPGTVTEGHDWIEAVLANCPDDGVRGYVRECAVEPLHTPDRDDEAARNYATTVVARLLEMDATRRLIVIKSKLQRTNPIEEPTKYNELFKALVALEAYRRDMRERALGEGETHGTV